jgi:phage terminase large subunit-like protein
VAPERWDFLARPDGTLAPGEVIALGFDGSKRRDATALIAERLSDRRLFKIRVWERDEDDPSWKIPTAQVDRAVRDTFGAYQVAVMFADPYRWQDYLDAWSAQFGEQRVVEFPTNVEQRFDRAIERFTTAAADGELTHDGDETFARHVKNAVIVKGSRKKIRPGEDETLAKHYLKLAKRADGAWIDAAVAAVLAHEAAAHAIEHDLVPRAAPAPFALVGD